MDTSLFQACAAFQKLANPLKITKNHIPVLQEISSNKQFDQRIEIADKEFEKLGKGSSRTVYKINDLLIIKIAHNQAGIVQNLFEMQPKMQTSCTNTIVSADTQGKWVIFRYNEKLSKDDFKKITGIDFDNFCDCILYTLNANSDDFKQPRNIEEVRKNELFQCITKLVIDTDLLVGDVLKINSYGLLDNRIVLRDVGLCRNDFKSYFESGSSSSSSIDTSES